MEYVSLDWKKSNQNGTQQYILGVNYSHCNHSKVKAIIFLSLFRAQLAFSSEICTIYKDNNYFCNGKRKKLVYHSHVEFVWGFEIYRQARKMSIEKIRIRIQHQID